MNIPRVLSMKNFLIGTLLFFISQGNVFAQQEVGSPAPDFSLMDSEGNTHTLSDYQEKVLFLFVMGYS